MALELFVLPELADGETLIEYVVDLSGRAYVIRLDWSTRELTYIFSMSTQSGSSIVRGRKLRHGSDVLAGVLHPERPPGKIVPFASDGFLPPVAIASVIKLLYGVEEDA